jgi:hypothetical protein
MNEEEIRKDIKIIPECSYCHKINLKKNIWDSIEKYKQIYDKYNAERKISHGCCPECEKKMEFELGLNE